MECHCRSNNHVNAANAERPEKIERTYESARKELDELIPEAIECLESIRYLRRVVSMKWSEWRQEQGAYGKTSMDLNKRDRMLGVWRRQLVYENEALDQEEAFLKLACEELHAEKEGVQ